MKMQTRSAIRILVAAVVLIGLYVAAEAKPPAGTDPNSPESVWYKGLIVPNGAPYAGLSCCSVADCRPVKIRTRDNSYEVFIDRRSFGPKAPDEWMTVPKERILRHTENPTGRVVACYALEQVRCLVLATMS